MVNSLYKFKKVFLGRKKDNKGNEKWSRFCAQLVLSSNKNVIVRSSLEIRVSVGERKILTTYLGIVWKKGAFNKTKFWVHLLYIYER